MSATVFDTPLDERSLIEASAGTGKTYALAGLFARAVIVMTLSDWPTPATGSSLP